MGVKKNACSFRQPNGCAKQSSFQGHLVSHLLIMAFESTAVTAVDPIDPIWPTFVFSSIFESMRPVFTHQLIDQRNAEYDRLIARRLRRERRLLRLARANLRRWSAADG